ncbi:MAG: phage tail protein [Gemmatimonadota bacterium]
MRTSPVIALLLTTLALPASVQAQDRPVVLGRLYNDPTPVGLLEPKGIEGIAGGTVRAATVELPEGPLAMALREAFEKGETLDELSLSVGSAGERSPYFPGSTKYTTIKLPRVRVTGVSPADTYGRVKVQFHWDRAGAAGTPPVGRGVSNLASKGNDVPAVEPRVAGGVRPGIQNDAQTAARFSITVDGVEVAAFSELAGISSSVEPVEFVLKHGKATGPAMWAWHEAVQAGNMATARKSAALVMYDYNGRPVARYHLENAWPSKVEAVGNVSDPEFLKARASRWGEVAMETVTIVSERIQRVAQ